jgi:hypothetical protein
MIGFCHYDSALFAHANPMTLGIGLLASALADPLSLVQYGFSPAAYKAWLPFIRQPEHSVTAYPSLAL